MSKSKARLLNLAQKTPGDEAFYERWHSWTDPVLEDAHILVVDQHVSVDEALLAAHPNLKYVCSATTGHTHLNFDAPQVQRVTLRGETNFLSQITSVSEHVFSLILRLLDAPYTPFRKKLSGKIIGIVGYGRIGKHVERIAKGFRMRVQTLDKENTKDQWRSVFRSSDIISIHLSENSWTRHLVNDEMLSCMQDGSYFINTARASVVDEAALLAHIKSRKIQAAALDVCSDRLAFDRERRVILTPHVAGSTLEDRIKTDEFLVAKTRNIIKHAADPFSL